MIFSNIERKIISIIQGSTDYITSEILSSKLDVSSRTIRNCIKGINELLVQHDARIISKPGYGYQLLINDEIEFANFLKEFILVNKSSKNDFSSTSEGRQYYILEKLIFEKTSMLLDDLAEELFVSRSTLSIDLREARKKIKPYHLEISSKPYQGISIVGQEKDIRHFVVKFFFENQFFNFKDSKEIWKSLFTEFDINSIIEVILEETRSHNITISDLVLQNLVIHVALALKRIKAGNKVLKFTANGCENLEAEYIAATAIIDKLQHKFSIVIPEEEKLHISLHLSAKKTFNISKYSFLDTEEDVHIEKTILSALSEIDQIYHLNLSDDKSFIQALKVHIRPMIIRLKNNIILDNPLLDEVFMKYENVISMVKDFSKYIGQSYHIEIPQEEIGYISFHFIVAVEKARKKVSYPTIIVCSTGYGSAILLKHKIEEVFPELEIVKVCSANELKGTTLDEVEMVISSLPIHALETEVPAIQVSVFLNDKDIKSIKDFIQQNKCSHHHSISKIVDAKKIKNRQTLLHYFKKHLYVKNADFQNQEQVIAYSANLLFIDKTISNKTGLIELIHQREELNSTVFSESFAVPHPITGIATEGRIIFMTLKKAILWGADKANFVDTIMLISPAKEENPRLIDIMNIFAKSALDKNLFYSIRNQNDFESFILTLTELL
ncbi:MAG: hypothetical protein H6Q69_762 [Firmicutes bacterium]|nr:hypothetical protein [Bacillota bacterium]